MSTTFANTSVSSNTTLSSNYTVYFVDCSGGSVVLTFPSLTGIQGRYYIIKRTDSSNNTLDLNVNNPSTENINGDAVTSLRIYGRESYETVAQNSTTWQFTGYTSQ